MPSDKEQNRLKRVGYLRKVICEAGRDCKHWLSWMAGICGYDEGPLMINDRRKCNCFTPSFEYRRRELHERLASVG